VAESQIHLGQDRRGERLRAFVSRHGLGAGIAILVVAGLVVVGTICQVNALAWGNRTFPGFLLNERLAVSTLSQEHWTGRAAGLRYPDRITRVNGVPVHSMNELMSIVEAAPPGTPFRYAVERATGPAEVAVASMRFSWGDLSVTFGISFLLGVAYLTIGTIVLILKFNTRISWVFFFACAGLSLNEIVDFDSQSTHFGFIKWYLASACFLPALALHFGLQFPRRVRFLARHPRLFLVPYLVSLGLLVAILALYPDRRFLLFWQVLMGYAALSVSVIVFPIVAEYVRPSDALARQRARMMLFGTALAFPVPMALMFSQYAFGSVFGLRVNMTYLDVPYVLFPAAIAYSIARHNLFDVDVYIKRALGYVIMLLVVGLGYFAIQTATVTLVLDPLFGAAAQNAYPVVFALLVVFLYNPLQSRVQRAVERLFYRGKADYKGTVSAVGEALASLFDLKEISVRIVEAVRDEMFVATAGVITIDRRAGTCSHFFVEERHGSLEGPRRREGVHDCDDPLLMLLDRDHKLITTYDLDEDPAYADSREAGLKRFEELGARLLIPLIVHGRLTGALAVGDRKSGRFFTREDIDLLTTLAHEGGSALENARMAQEMKKEELVRTNLSRYLSPQIVEQVVNRNVILNLGGDRKEVTVLFSDIRNFTSITESRPADQLVQILNHYFTEMAGIIFAHNGSLDKYIGDAIVAVFGSLIEVENPARNAVEAAVEMMRRMPALNERWLADYGFTMEMGIGINSGEVFLGNIGSPERMEFTVIGDTVNVASRFSGLAKGGQILLTRTAATRLDGAVALNALPPAKVKGKAEVQEVFEVEI
jgi:class 3 adenylate cyclase